VAQQSKILAEVIQLQKFLNSNGIKKKKVVFSPTGKPNDKTFAGEYITGKFTHPLPSNRAC
jgi:hypothetical protein